MNLGRMTQIIDRKKYDTATATLLASDVYWDGNNMERSGRNTWLFRTAKGAYFFAHRTMWQGEEDSIAPCDQEEALAFYEAMQGHDSTEVAYEDAFPDVAVEEA